MGNVTIKIYDDEICVSKDTTLLELAKRYKDKEEHAIVLAYMDNRLCELSKTTCIDADVKFITTGEKIGNETYKRSVLFLMLKAVQDVLGSEAYKTVRVMYSISKGYYCEITECKEKLNEALLDSVKARMQELVGQDLPIHKRSLSTDEVIANFKAHGMEDKARLFKYRRVSKANLYRIDNYEDYFYGYMVPSTGYLTYFDLYLYGDGFVLQMPTAKEPEKVPAFEPQAKLFDVLKQSDDWGVMMDVDTVGALNDVIAGGGFNDLVLVQEALQEKYIAEIASKIASQNKKIVLIAGPSSSGKTSLSHRLSIQLKAQGMTPHPIAMDDYFVDRELTPRDADGKYDFECLGALDVKKFNEDINALLAGEKINMPTFNFQTGKREYRGNTLQIAKKDVLVIEGIHGLNPELTANLPEESKFRIYISALTQLNVDEHNRIATTDGRLIRRIVRDARTRGNSAQNTIAMWHSVRRGEEQNIFPYQENADVMFNSALIYELCVIKQYVEPLLFAIPKDAPEFVEAKRLLKFLDYFLGVSSENIPNNSILREFIGGSCFKV